MQRVRFEFEAPGAREVWLAGEFTNWEAGKRKMARKRDNPDVFIASCSLLPGEHHYKFIVDGNWREDPRAPAIENDFGTRNSVITVAAPARRARRTAVAE